MCYGNPQQLLDEILKVRRLQPDRHGHTALDISSTFARIRAATSGPLGRSFRVGEAGLRERATAACASQRSFFG